MAFKMQAACELPSAPRALGGSAALVVLVSVSLWSRPAACITSPVGGAVAAPATVSLRAPFPCGVSFKVTCAYYSGCSKFHLGTASSSSANDAFALDLVRAETGGGFGEPVSAVAAGTVKYAGWSTGGWSPYGQIVVLEHDFGDGKVYQSLYAHLQSISVKLGQKLAVGAEVGTLGGSSNGKLAGLASHLHFALYRGAKLEGGPYGGVAVVPEPLSGLADIVTGKMGTVSCPSTPPPTPPAPDAGTAPPAAERSDRGSPPEPEIDGAPAELSTPRSRAGARPTEGCQLGGGRPGLSLCPLLVALLLGLLRPRPGRRPS